MRSRFEGKSAIGWSAIFKVSIRHHGCTASLTRKAVICAFGPNSMALADEAHKVIDSTGWGLRLRGCQWLFACIITSLAAFIFSKFESWKWAPVIIAFV